MANEVIRLLSLNPYDEVLLENIHNVEAWLNQEGRLCLEEKKKIIEGIPLEKLQPHQRYAEVFRIVSSGECSKEELERCKNILSLLTPDEINDIDLWRGIPLVIRIASLMCEGNWAYDLFPIIFSKPGIDVSSLVKIQDGEVIVSRNHIHDVNVEKQIREYHLGKTS